MHRTDAGGDHHRHRDVVFGLHGAFLLAVYCAGLGVPFLITGLAFGTATAALAAVKRHYPVVIGAGGVILSAWAC